MDEIRVCGRGNGYFHRRNPGVIEGAHGFLAKLTEIRPHSCGRFALNFQPFITLATSDGQSAA